MRHRLKILHIAAATIVLLALAACGVPLATPGGAGIDFSSRTIQVVATTGHVAEAVRNVGGQRVAVEALMGPGVDPHLYKASAGDVIKIQNADVVMYNGLALEGRMIDIFERLGRTKPTYAIADAIPAELLRAPPEFQGAYDPHVWFDPIRWSYAVDETARRLSELDPAQRGDLCRQRRGLPRRAVRPRPIHAPQDRVDPGIVARADHRARRLRLLRRPVRHGGSRPAGHQHGQRGRRRRCTGAGTAISPSARFVPFSSSRACRKPRSKRCRRQSRRVASR